MHAKQDYRSVPGFRIHVGARWDGYVRKIKF